MVNGEVTGRWGVHQVAHGSTHSYMPNVFGVPRARSLWIIINVMEFMDEWFIDTFSEGRLQKIINFPRYDQTKLTDLMRKIQAESQKLKVWDQRTLQNRTKKSLRTMMVASEDPIGVYDVGINPQDIQLMDYYKLCIQAACGIYGVQPLSIANNLATKGSGSGQAGTPAMQIEVQNDTIRDIQNDKEEIINNQLLPIFGVTDWVFRFNPIEEKDARREAEINKMISETATNLITIGFDVWFDDYNQMQWSKKPKPLPAPVSTSKDEPEKKPKNTGKSPRKPPYRDW